MFQLECTILRIYLKEVSRFLFRLQMNIILELYLFSPFLHQLKCILQYDFAACLFVIKIIWRRSYQSKQETFTKQLPFVRKT